MNRTALIVLAASGLVFAQTQPTTGGWRRASDPPQTQPPATASTQTPPVQGADPEPVDRSDAYGQPMPQQQNRQPYGLPAEMTMKSGTFVTVRLAQSLSSDHSKQGETFVAHLAQPLIVDGIVVAERGQTVYGTVEQAERAKAGSQSKLGVQLTSLTLADGTQVPVNSLMVSYTGPRTPGGVQAATVAGTTGAGAVIGGAVGWGTGAAIGAGVGAVAGIAGVILTRNHPTVLYPESLLTFKTTSPVGISTVRTPQAFRFVGPEDQAPVNAQLRPRPQVRYVPRPYGPAPYAYGPYPYPYPYAYPYPYWGPGFAVGVGVWGRPGWGRWR